MASRTAIDNESRLTREERSRLHAAIDVHGEAHVIDALRVSRQTLARAVAGLELRRGSTALIRSHMPMLMGRRR